MLLQLIKRILDVTGSPAHKRTKTRGELVSNIRYAPDLLHLMLSATALRRLIIDTHVAVFMGALDQQSFEYFRSSFQTSPSWC